MNNRRQNIDGFVVRRRPMGPAGPSRLGTENLGVPDRFKQGPVSLPQPMIDNRRSRQDEVPRLGAAAIGGLSRQELDMSLSSLDETPPAAKSVGKRRLRRPDGHIVKRIVLGMAVIALIVLGYLGVKFLIASGRVFSGNLFDIIGSSAELKKDSRGRTNILVFGTSEDDPSHQDAGANLTDSLMVVSIDQKLKDAKMFSVPRDLWVKYGQACNSGYEGKINEIYGCYSNNGADEPAGAQALMDNISKNFGVELQYYVHVNYTVVKQAVDAVGGVDVTIDSYDKRGILDRNFDWKCRYQCYYVKWPNGPAHLDGEHALALARARGDNNGQATYGLGGGNFDREKYQQKIIIALKEKATASGTLANPLAVVNLMDSLGNNIRTNFQTKEVKTLIGLAKDMKPQQIGRISLVDEKNPMVRTGMIGAASAVYPQAGIYQYSQIQRYIASKLSTEASDSEVATIEVLNGSDKSGVAGKESDRLAAAGFSGISIGDTETRSTYAPIEWYDLSGGKLPQTAKKLASYVGKPAKATALPPGVQSSADFVIILGNGTN